jgi:hypothetical protein
MPGREAAVGERRLGGVVGYVPVGLACGGKGTLAVDGPPEAVVAGPWLGGSGDGVGCDAIDEAAKPGN